MTDGWSIGAGLCVVVLVFGLLLLTLGRAAPAGPSTRRSSPPVPWPERPVSVRPCSWPGWSASSTRPPTPSPSSSSVFILNFAVTIALRLSRSCGRRNDCGPAGSTPGLRASTQCRGGQLASLAPRASVSVTDHLSLDVPGLVAHQPGTDAAQLRTVADQETAAAADGTPFGSNIASRSRLESRPRRPHDDGGREPDGHLAPDFCAFVPDHSVSLETVGVGGLPRPWHRMLPPQPPIGRPRCADDALRPEGRRVAPQCRSSASAHLPTRSASSQSSTGRSIMQWVVPAGPPRPAVGPTSRTPANPAPAATAPPSKDAGPL